MNKSKLLLSGFLLGIILLAPLWQPPCEAQPEIVTDLIGKAQTIYRNAINSLHEFIMESTSSGGPSVQNFMSKFYSRQKLEFYLWGLILLIVVIMVVNYLIGKLKKLGSPKTRSPKQLIKEAKSMSKKGMHLQAGDLYRQCKMTKHAVEQYKEAKAYIRLGDLCKENKDWDMAAQWYEKAGNYSNAAEIYFKAKRYEKAEQMYLKDNRDTLVGEMYEKVGEYRRAGLAYKNSGYFDKAAEMFDRAADHQNAAQMYQQAFMDQGGTKLATGDQLNPRLRDLITKAAEHFIQSGALEQAAEAYARGGMYEKSADLYIKLKDFNKAAVFYQKAEASDKAAVMFDQIGNAEMASKFKAEALLRSGDAAEAAEQFAQSKDYAQAADLYVRVEDWMKAAEMYEKNGDYESAAEMYIRAEKFDKAAEVYEKANQFANAAFMYERLGDFRRQAQLLYQLQEYYKAGTILMENGLIEDALKVLQQVPAESPDYIDTCVLIGNIFLYKKMYSLALKKFRGAIGGQSVNIKNLEPYYFTALILEGAGKTADALKIYHDILAIDYNYRDVQTHIENLKQKGIAASSISADTIITSSTEDIDRVSLPETSVPILRTAAIPEPSGVLVFSTGVNENGHTVVYQSTGSSSKPSKPRYIMMEELGRGGMGIVFLAKDTVLNRMVAFKVLSGNLKNDEWALETFFREARAAAALNHPNIIHVYDASTDENNVFIVMEYVDGINLKDVMRKKGILKPAALAAIFRQVCAGLGYAHSQKVIHRDIKPSNIMLTQSKQVKIADFGLAKVLSEIKDSQSMISGTPYYMAPEQILGKDVDNRADIYSLGVTLYEMATGIVPFPSGEVNYHHVHTPPPDPKNTNKDISDKLREIILKCLEKDPEQRYQTMYEISKELKQIS